MYEVDAKTKWCPMVRTGRNAFFVRVPPVGDDPANRNPPEARCIGSDCMMWRKHARHGGGGPSTEGHCGLAGNE